MAGSRYRGSWHKDKKRKPDSRRKTLGKAECVYETDKAILVKWGLRGAHELWVPQSAVHDNSEVWKLGQSGKLVVYAWWAELRGLQAESRKRR